MPVSLRAFLVCWQPLDPTSSEIKLQSAISAAVVQPLSAEGLIWKRNGFSKIQLRVCNLSIHSFHSTSTVLYLNNVYYILPHTWGGKAIHLQLIDFPGHNTSTFLLSGTIEWTGTIYWLNRTGWSWRSLPVPWEFESCRISVNNLQTARKCDRVLFKRQITV